MLMSEFIVSASNAVPLIECTFIALHVSALSCLESAGMFCKLVVVNLGVYIPV
jgi:hypothetical protein